LTALQRLFAVCFEGLSLFRLQLGSVSQKAIEAAVMRDQIDRALLADARNASHVVARIAHECEYVDDLRRLHAKLLDDPSFIEPRSVLARVVNGDRVVANELKEVLVDRNDRHLVACRGRPRRDRSEHIVGFVARHGEDWDAHRLTRLVDPIDLLDQIVWHLRAVGLVIGHDLVAERGAGQVERGSDMGRVVIGEELSQHRDKNVDGVRRTALLV
jgi:hypothetical protein